MSTANQNQLTADLRGLFPKNPFAPGVFKRIHEYRDNGTYADEALRIIKYVLLPISAIFTLAFGWALHYNIFSTWIGSTPAHISAALFTLFIEVSKILIGIYTIRLIFFGMFWRGVPDAFLTATMLVIFCGAFWWSYYNSTTGIKYAAKFSAEWKINRKITDPATAAAPLSKNIETTAETVKKGIGIKWKGKTTREGQRIAENATAAIAEQEKQKTILMQKAADEQKISDTSRDIFINTSSGLFSNLGGKMEWFQLFLIISMVLSEKILWSRNPEKLAKQTPKQSNQTHIGFNTDTMGNVRAAVTTPVNGLPNKAPHTMYHNVPQHNTPNDNVGADAILKNAHAAIQRDLKNLENENGRPRTVCDRIHAAIITQSREVRKTGFAPSPRLATDYYTFIRDTVFPTLENYGRPYEYSKQVLADLEDFIDENELSLYEAQKPQA